MHPTLFFLFIFLNLIFLFQVTLFLINYSIPIIQISFFIFLYHSLHLNFLILILNFLILIYFFQILIISYIIAITRENLQSIIINYWDFLNFNNNSYWLITINLIKLICRLHILHTNLSILESQNLFMKFFFPYLISILLVKNLLSLNHILHFLNLLSIPLFYFVQFLNPLTIHLLYFMPLIVLSQPPL